jgi:hypothetical protein
LKGEVMNTQHIRNTLFAMLTIALLAGSAQDGYAQRTRLNSERRNSDQRVARTTVKKDKAVKKDIKKSNTKVQSKRTNRNQSTYRKNEHIKRNQNLKKQQQNQKKEYRRSNKDQTKSTYRTNEHTKHNQNLKKQQSSPKKEYWRSNKIRTHFDRRPQYNFHYRKPSWTDFHSHGFYYPRIGARFSFLPHGHISFRIGDFRFYSYHGVYYRYDPVIRSYIVIEKPPIKTVYQSTKWDRITLMDGSTIEGVYIGGDDETVQFEVGDAILEIPMSEIKVLSFSQQ